MVRRQGPGLAVIWFRVRGRVEGRIWGVSLEVQRSVASAFGFKWESQLEGPCGFLKVSFGGLL